VGAGGGAGEGFGERSLVDGRPRGANVAALQPTQLIRIDRDDFEEAGMRNLELLRFRMEIMAKRIRNTNALAAAFAPARVGGELAESLKADAPAATPTAEAVFTSADAALVGAPAAAAPETTGGPAAQAAAEKPVKGASPSGPRNTERRW